MRLPEPKKLPSGNWRIQVLVDGKRVGRTFPTKEEAEYWAAGLKTKAIEENRSPWKMTVGAAVDRYIESKSSILSPSTVLGYKRTKKRMEDIHCLKSLIVLNLLSSRLFVPTHVAMLVSLPYKKHLVVCSLPK